MRKILDSPGKVAVTIVVFLLAVLGVSYFGSIAFDLMNESSDVSVAAGVVILLVITASVFWVAGRAIKYFANKGNNSRVLGLFMMFGLALSLSGCAGCTRVGPGYVGIKVNLSGDKKGVQDIPASTGWVFYNSLTQQVFKYPTFVQTAVWTKDANEGSVNNEEVTFNTKEGLIMTGDISLSYQLDATKIPAFYVKFRSDDLNTFTHGFLRNIARDRFNDEAGNYPVEELYGIKKEEFIKRVKSRINADVKGIGVSLEQFGFIGAPRPPQQVIDAINAKISATQEAMKSENQLRQAKAEAEKTIAKARGEASANEILAKSISPQLIEWRRLEILQTAISRWNGQRPMVEGASSGLLLELPMSKVFETPAPTPTPKK